MIPRNRQLQQRNDARKRSDTSVSRANVDSAADAQARAAGAQEASQPSSASLTALTTAAVAVSALPAAASSAWQRRFVNDALAPAFLAVVANGGAIVTPVFSDGTNWRCG